MQLARRILILDAVAFLAIGAAFLLAPVAMARLVELRVESPTADNDLRAVYGGLQLGLGIFLLLGALRASWLRPALAAATLAFGGLAAARVVSWGVAGLPGLLGLLLHLAETVGFLASAWGWARGSRPPATPASTPS